MDILKRITLLRKERGWSEYRLAKEANLPQSTITNLYKRGNTPTFTTLEAICKAFGISLAQFFSTNETVALTKDQHDLLAQWVLLSHEQKEKVTAYMQGLLQQ